MIRTLNIIQVNWIEKGIATFFLEGQFKKAVKKYYSDVRFDMVIYSTPPVTFSKVVVYIKNRDNALSYLLLKDIFPQNAVDLGMIRKGSLVHRYFRNKEKNLYSISDFIGCMSPANVDFIKKHNPEINPDKLEVNPNTIEPVSLNFNKDQKSGVRLKYRIPLNTPVFVYGGSLGKPQGIDFLIELLSFQINNREIFIVIAGSGTYFPKLHSWFSLNQPENMLLLTELPRDEYSLLVQSCDAGFIFLDGRFTIPNFPSRLLSYLECKIPVIAATDRNTDLGKIIQENDFGLWSETGDLQSINKNIARISQDSALRSKMGLNGYNYLLKNYTVTNSYMIISKHFYKT